MCPYCHKTFKTSVNCRKHIKTHKHELALQVGKAFFCQTSYMVQGFLQHIYNALLNFLLHHLNSLYPDVIPINLAVALHSSML